MLWRMGRDRPAALNSWMIPRPAAGLAALHRERREAATACHQVKAHILGPGAALRGKDARSRLSGDRRAHARPRHRAPPDPRSPEKAGEDSDRLFFVHTVQVMGLRIFSPCALPSSESVGRCNWRDSPGARRLQPRPGQAVRRQAEGKRPPLRRRDPVSRRQHDRMPEIVPNCALGNSITARRTHKFVKAAYALFCQSEMRRFAGYGMPVIDNHFVRRRHTVTMSNGGDAVPKIKELSGAQDQLIREGLQGWLQQILESEMPEELGAASATLPGGRGKSLPAIAGCGRMAG